MLQVVAFTQWILPTCKTYRFYIIDYLQILHLQTSIESVFSTEKTIDIFHKREKHLIHNTLKGESVNTPPEYNHYLVHSQLKGQKPFVQESTTYFCQSHIQNFRSSHKWLPCRKLPAKLLQSVSYHLSVPLQLFLKDEHTRHALHSPLPIKKSCEPIE